MKYNFVIRLDMDFFVEFITRKTYIPTQFMKCFCVRSQEKRQFGDSRYLEIITLEMFIFCILTSVQQSAEILHLSKK